MNSLDSRSDLLPDLPPFGFNWDHKVADLCFCLISPLFLLLEFLSNSNSIFIAPNLPLKTDSRCAKQKAENYSHKPET